MTSEKEVSLEVAVKRLGKSERTVRSYIKAKKLQATKVGNKWFVDSASLDRLVGKEPEGDNASSGKFPEDAHSDVGIERLACFKLGKEAFAMPMWMDVNENKIEDLSLARQRYFSSIGAGYYSFGSYKSRYYSDARATIGSSVALIAALGKKEQWGAELEFMEKKLMPALTSLIRKIEKTRKV